LDFDLLSDYLAVIRHGSILAAAEASGTNQPRLSRRMRELEDALGVLLLNRTSRGVSPTVYGEAFRRHAETVLQEHARVVDELRSLKAGTRGHARIGLAPALAGYLPLAIAALRRQTPGVTFEILEGTYDSLVEAALKGEIDGAFTMLPPGESVESLAVTPLKPEPVVIVGHGDHPLASSDAVELSDLADASWALINRPRSILDAFLQVTAARGLATPDVATETSSLDFLKSTVRCGDALTVVPRGAVHAELASGSFASLAVADLPSVETAFVHRHGVLAPLVTALVHEVEALRARADA